MLLNTTKRHPTAKSRKIPGNTKTDNQRGLHKAETVVKQTTTRERKLSEREKEFARQLLHCRKPEEAAIQAGYSKSYARARAYKLSAKIGVREEMNRLLATINLDLDTLGKQAVLRLQGFADDPYTSTTDRIRCCEDLCKLAGLFVERHAIGPDLGRRPPDLASAELIRRQRLLGTGNKEIAAHVQSDDAGKPEA